MAENVSSDVILWIEAWTIQILKLRGKCRLLIFFSTKMLLSRTETCVFIFFFKLYYEYVTHFYNLYFSLQISNASGRVSELQSTVSQLERELKKEKYKDAEDNYRKAFVEFTVSTKLIG